MRRGVDIPVFLEFVDAIAVDDLVGAAILLRRERELEEYIIWIDINLRQTA